MPVDSALIASAVSCEFFIDRSTVLLLSGPDKTTALDAAVEFANAVPAFTVLSNTVPPPLVACSPIASAAILFRVRDIVSLAFAPTWNALVLKLPSSNFCPPKEVV